MNEMSNGLIINANIKVNSKIISKSRSFPVNKFTPDALIFSVYKNIIKVINPKCDELSRFIKAGNALTGRIITSCLRILCTV
jgi:hypothetical protein